MDGRGERAELKAIGDGELQVHGSSRLIQWLLEKDLVDEMELIVVPVVLGQGARLFAGAGRDVAMNLVDSRSDSKGVMIQTYRPAGRRRRGHEGLRPENRGATVRVNDVEDAITRAYRDEWARVVAGLAGRFGNLDLAEEATAEAFATAVARWPADGMPSNPGAWLTTTAHRKGIDRLRRENQRDAKHKEALVVSETTQPSRSG